MSPHARSPRLVNGVTFEAAGPAARLRTVGPETEYSMGTQSLGPLAVEERLELALAELEMTKQKLKEVEALKGGERHSKFDVKKVSIEEISLSDPRDGAESSEVPLEESMPDKLMTSITERRTTFASCHMYPGTNFS